MSWRAILAGVTLSVAAGGVASAADFAGPPPGGLKDVPFVAVPWTWNGFYAGLTAGYGTGDSSNFVSANDNAPHGWANNNPSGGLLGATIGYNYQFAPTWVVGAEADWSWSGMEGQQHKYVYDGHDWSGGWDGFATIRARAGYAMGRALFYATGGLALVHANEAIAGNDADESNFYQGWKTGYVVGAGIEYAFAPNVTGKIEYLFADGFGNESGYTGTVSQHGDQTYIHQIGNIDVVRVGVNYKFW